MRKLFGMTIAVSLVFCGCAQTPGAPAETPPDAASREAPTATPAKPEAPPKPLVKPEPAWTEDVLALSGVSGGIVVHLGCGAGTNTPRLKGNDGIAVHGLEADAAKVALARERIAELGLYGDVSVERFEGARLPYAEGLVSLIVVEDRGRVTDAEIMRALAPGGAALVREGGAWSKRLKPYPDTMDEWTHFLHDASNNAVASDSVVGQPRRLRWVAGPRWLRSHEIPSGIQNAVTAKGRLFYFFDEGLVGITDQRMPSKYSLVARDAFSGRFLWKRRLEPWGWREWAAAKYGGKDWHKTRAFRTQVPGQNQRRMVVAGDRLLVTLGYDAPMSILDAATGKVLKTIDETKGIHEFAVDAGIAVGFIRGEDKLVAVSAESGTVLWRVPAPGYRGMTLAVKDGRVHLVASEGLVCLDQKTGERQWRQKAAGKGLRNLVVAEGVVLTLGGKLEAHDARSGEKLWGVKSVRSAYGVDLFVARGLVWQGVQIRGENAKAVGLDPRTGKPKRTINVKKLISPEHHHRCYRNKATERFVILSYEGAEFVDLVGDEHGQNNFLRGACKYGMMPANGLLYVPPDQCFCQPGAKMLGFTAVGPAAKLPVPPVAADARLVKGPAYVSGASPAATAVSDPENEWPTFRHDAARHGSTKGVVTGAGSVAWKVEIGGRLTAPVSAGGRVYVAAVDRHTLYALDAKTGERKWSFVAGGRIDSPPTVHGGLVLLGSRDGRVHCLRAADGAEVWSFLAAPHDRRVGAFGQLESAWPVHGSVLVQGGVAFVGAGRSTYLDGGIYLWALDPATGKLLARGHTSGPETEVGKKRHKAFFIPGANSDVLVAEGAHVYMRQLKFTPELDEVDIPVLSTKGEKDAGLHVFSTAGLLDGSWYNRTFWMYSKRWPGFQLANQSPKAGQILVVDDETTYAVKVFHRRNTHSTMFLPGKEGYLLYADRNSNEPQIVGEKGSRPPLRWLPMSDYWRATRNNEVRKLDSKAFGLDKMIGYTRAEPEIWKTWVKVRVRALVKAGDRLWAAGPPDVYEEADPHASFEGRRGAVLMSLSAADGKPVSETKLASPPVFDGMIAASGRLYISLEDGSLVCMGP